MPSKTKGLRPVAPTRLAEKKKNTGDRFETQVFYIAQSDLFFITNCTTEPEKYEWTVFFENEKLIIEMSDGSNSIGTATVLDFWDLPNSDQWRPPRLINWLSILALWLGWAA